MEYKYQAKYFETYSGTKYYRDQFGNIYCRLSSGEIAYCSNLKKGSLTEEKAEPCYPVNDTLLID